MKYIMFQCKQNGNRTFCLFSDSLTHSEMKRSVGYAGRCEGQWLEPIGAGFVHWEDDIPVTSGRSESMNLDSNPEDALYIWGGAPVQFLEPAMVASVLMNYKEKVAAKKTIDDETDN